jgi:flagellar motility protein MotE (MotC chaperone)
MDDQKENSGGGKGIFVFALLLSLTIIFGVWGYLIKTNKFFGLGEILRPYMQNIPVISMILPAPPNPSDPLLFPREQLNEEYKKVLAEKQAITAQNEELLKEVASKKEIEDKYNILKKEVDILNKELETNKSQQSEEQLKQESTENIKNIVKTYETMDPAEAAKILEQMGTLNIELVIKICKQMKTSSFSAILQEMDTNFAAILSENMLAEG